jgi:hypothetical protein
MGGLLLVGQSLKRAILTVELYFGKDMMFEWSSLETPYSLSLQQLRRIQGEVLVEPPL